MQDVDDLDPIVALTIEDQIVAMDTATNALPLKAGYERKRTTNIANPRAFSLSSSTNDIARIGLSRAMKSPIASRPRSASRVKATFTPPRVERPSPRIWREGGRIHPPHRSADRRRRPPSRGRSRCPRRRGVVDALRAISIRRGRLRSHRCNDHWRVALSRRFRSDLRACSYWAWPLRSRHQIMILSEQNKLELRYAASRELRLRISRELQGEICDPSCRLVFCYRCPKGFPLLRQIPHHHQIIIHPRP